jgi:hypothetical protein
MPGSPPAVGHQLPIRVTLLPPEMQNPGPPGRAMTGVKTLHHESPNIMSTLVSARKSRALFFVLTFSLALARALGFGLLAATQSGSSETRAEQSQRGRFGYGCRNAGQLAHHAG